MSKPDIVQVIKDYNTWTPSELVQAYNGRTGAVAAELAGTRETKSRAYQTAQRNVQRWLKGRTPSEAQQAKLNEMGKKTQGSKQIGVTYAGSIAVNGMGDNYRRDREINRTYDEEQWAELSRLAMNGDEAGLWSFIAGEYRVRSLEVVDGTITIGEE